MAGWASLVLIVLWYFIHRLRWELSWEAFLVAWSLISGIGIIASWAAIRGTYFAVTPARLQIGRSPRETIVEFDEIESIVVGLPTQQSGILRLGRFSHFSQANYRKLAERRRDSIPLRLRGGNYLALYIPRAFIANPDTLKSTLLRRNRGKVVGAETYTPHETSRLGNVNFNRVRMM